MLEGDNLFVYDVQDDTRTTIAELDYNFNNKKKTFSSAGNHSLLIHFSTNEQSVWLGFSALIHYIPINSICADFLDKNQLILTKPIDCNWIITAPSVTSTITIKFQFFEVSIHITLSQMKTVWQSEKSSRSVCPLENQFNICWILLYFFLNILALFKYTMKIGHFFLIHTL